MANLVARSLFVIISRRLHDHPRPMPVGKRAKLAHWRLLHTKGGIIPHRLSRKGRRRPESLLFTPRFVPIFQAMALTSQDIARVAHLARLALRPEETEHTLGQLNGFFSLVTQMAAVNTDGVEPLAHPAAVLGQVALRLREDVASEPNQRDASQVSAPAVERGLFLVPKVIE
jgi:aspartyl-tRNA(Asn)/glutamyl-tRNA(Gln) amidotransferase subunit C